MVKPMLACKISDLSELTYPLLASRKLDGIRILTTKEGPRTRSLKEIPNIHIRTFLSKLPSGLDGEVGVVRDGSLAFRESTSAVMSEDGSPDFKFFIFDYWSFDKKYRARFNKLKKLKLPNWCVILEQEPVSSPEEVLVLFEKYLSEGHEGLMLRSSDAYYKFGRGSKKHQELFKMKPWEDSEGICIRTEEEMHNGNEAETNELGRTKRSSKKVGLVGKGTIGTLILKSEDFLEEVQVGSGLTAEDRLRKDFVGKIVKFKYTTTGDYSKPRHPVYLGVRDERDIS